MTRITTLLLLAPLLFLAACAGGGTDDAEVGAAGMSEAIDGYRADVEVLQADVAADAAFAVLSSEASAAAVADLGASLQTLPESGGLPPLGPSQAGGQLPTGEFVYEPVTGLFEDSGAATDDLVYRWTTTTANDTELSFDWDANGAIVDLATGEAFTGLNVTLDIGGEVGADLDVSASYADTVCENLTRATLDGFVGVDATLTADAVTVGLDATSADTSGALTVAADGDSASFDWAVDLQGAFFDDGACALLPAPEVTSGTIAFGTSSSVGGDTTSFDFDVAFTDVVTDASGMPVSAAVDGSIDVNGTDAVSFAGTLNDADGDGVIGDEVELAFTDGDSMTLEAFLESNGTFAAVRSMASLLR